MDLKSLKKKIRDKAGKAEAKIRSVTPWKKRKSKYHKWKVSDFKKSDEKLDFIDEIFKDLEGEDVVKNPRFVVMGIGNDLKGDDGVGWYVTEKVGERVGKDKNLLLLKTSVPENHIKEVSDFSPKLLVIVDAADFGKPPGTVKLIQEYQISRTAISTHSSPLTIFLRLYQADESLKKPVMIIGIQRESNEFGQPMSAPVKSAGDTVAKVIARLYRKGTLDLSLRKELEYSKEPLRKFIDYFRKTSAS